MWCLSFWWLEVIILITIKIKTIMVKMVLIILLIVGDDDLDEDDELWILMNDSDDPGCAEKSTKTSQLNCESELADELSWVRVVLGTSCLRYELSIIHGIRTTRTQDNSYPGQFVTKTTRTQDNSYRVNSYPRQLVPKKTSTQDNSFPRQLVPGSPCSKANSYPSQIIPRTTRIQDNSYPRQFLRRACRIQDNWCTLTRTGPTIITQIHKDIYLKIIYFDNDGFVSSETNNFLQC